LGWLGTRSFGEEIIGVRERNWHDGEKYTTYYDYIDIRNDGVVVTYRAYGGDVKCVQNFSGVTYREE
jgi:hypothetical protein